MIYKKVGMEKLSDVVSVNKKIFEHLYSWPPYEEEEYRQRFVGVDPSLFIAEEGAQIVGDSVAFQKDNAWYIWILGVDEAYRRRGIADHLYELNEQHAKEIACNKVTVKIYNVSRDMIRLALKRGYLITDIKKDANPKYHALVMELPL